MTATEILGLVIAAMAGGAVNAVAGGGTLVTFPALLLFGTPPVVANATSTFHDNGTGAVYQETQQDKIIAATINNIQLGY